MTTYPLATLGPTITTTGITAPSYADVILSLQASYKLLYGTDVSLDEDDQDGQWLAIQAQAISDANSAAIAIFNAFSPGSAVGVALSNIVKINGIRRYIATNSTVDVLIVGQAGSPINNGSAKDTLNQIWNLPSSVTIPPGGSITVTATAANPGAVTAAENTVNTINTPTAGWQSVNNPADAATPGAPIETDAQLRQRQAASTGTPAQTPLDAIVGAVEALSGVTRVKPYENDTSTTDGNGVPPHSICLVVEGGDATEIAQTIVLKKNPGTGTYGTTSELVLDSHGVPTIINFYRPTNVRMIWAVTLTPLPGYVSSTGVSITQNIAAYGNTLDIGNDVYQSKIEARAELQDPALSAQYNTTLVQIARYGNSLGTADVDLSFIEAATFDPADGEVIT